MAETTQSDAESVDVLDLLWGRRAPATRGPKANLSLDQIVTAALAVADAEGIEAVSMQAVADRLGYSKMSLYRHVTTKDALLAVMIDAAVGPPPDIGRVPGGWRRRLEAYARALWERWQRYPWLPGATIGGRVMGPNEVGWVEQAVRALDGTGLSGDERIDVVLLVSGHVRTTHSLASSGTFPWTAERRLSPSMTSLLWEEAERFPAILDAVGSAPTRPIRHVDDGLGLGCILDGLEITAQATIDINTANMAIDRTFIIPGDDQPLTYKYSAWLPPDLKRWEQPGTTPKDMYEHLGREGVALLERGRQDAHALVRERLAVGHARARELGALRRPAAHRHDHERAEVVALAGLVAADQRALPHRDRAVGRRGGPGAAQVALGEERHLAALHHELPRTVERGDHPLALDAEAGVLDRPALEVAGLELALEAGLRGRRELDDEGLLRHGRCDCPRPGGRREGRRGTRATHRPGETRSREAHARRFRHAAPFRAPLRSPAPCSPAISDWRRSRSLRAGDRGDTDLRARGTARLARTARGNMGHRPRAGSGRITLCSVIRPTQAARILGFERNQPHVEHGHQRIERTLRQDPEARRRHRSTSRIGLDRSAQLARDHPSVRAVDRKTTQCPARRLDAVNLFAVRRDRKQKQFFHPWEEQPPRHGTVRTEGEQMRRALGFDDESDGAEDSGALNVDVVVLAVEHDEAARPRIGRAGDPAGGCGTPQQVGERRIDRPLGEGRKRAGDRLQGPQAGDIGERPRDRDRGARLPQARHQRGLGVLARPDHDPGSLEHRLGALLRPVADEAGPAHQAANQEGAIAEDRVEQGSAGGVARQQGACHGVGFRIVGGCTARPRRDARHCSVQQLTHVLRLTDLCAVQRIHAAAACEPTNFESAQCVGGMNADADNVTVRHTVDVERFERFVGDRRHPEAIGGAARVELQSPDESFRLSVGAFLRLSWPLGSVDDHDALLAGNVGIVPDHIRYNDLFDPGAGIGLEASLMLFHPESRERGAPEGPSAGLYVSLQVDTFEGSPVSDGSAFIEPGDLDMATAFIGIVVAIGHFLLFPWLMSLFGSPEDLKRNVQILDGILVVADAKRTDRDEVEQVRIQFEQVGGQVVGVSSKSVFGSPGRVAGIVVGEWEERSPWAPLAERRGVTGNAVTVHGCTGTIDVADITADNGADLLEIIGKSIVPGEVDRLRVETTTSPHAVVDFLNQDIRPKLPS